MKLIFVASSMPRRYRYERSIFQLDFQEEDEVIKEIKVLKEEELGIAPDQESEVEQAPQGGLPKVVGILRAVFR